jgi:hypothetical protein
MGTNIFTFEELTTLTTQIEACLNSRPLVKMTDDSTDPEYLTPSHFLIGKPLTALPDYDHTSSTVNSLTRWQYLQWLTKHFWRRWSKEYVNSLQQRQKWTDKKPNLHPGDLVLVKDDKLAPLRWMTGVIQDVHPGDDGLVRVATLRTNSGLIKRPIHRLCLLPIEG